MPRRKDREFVAILPSERVDCVMNLLNLTIEP